MANAWFRFYSEALHDEKVQKLSTYLFKLWVNSLCLYSQKNHIIPDLKTWAFGLRISETKMKEVADELMQRELFEQDANGYHPHNWKNRQYKSDSSTERVKRFRNVSCNVSVTPPDTDTETDTDTDKRVPPTPKGERRVDITFNTFWSVYPKKSGKGAAQKSFEKINPNAETLAAMITAIDWQKQTDQWRRDKGQYIPMPATWINQRRWEDEPIEPTRPVLAPALKAGNYPANPVIPPGGNDESQLPF